MKIGVLSLQGAVSEHLNALEKLGVAAVLVKDSKSLGQIQGLIIPGGESTTLGKLLVHYELLSAIKEKALKGLPLMGTCAGMILMAKKISDGLTEQANLSLMEIEVKRNAFGRQKDSFEAELAVQVLGEKPFPGVFIRAPLISGAAPQVEVLCKYQDQIVAAKQDNFLALAFHPELTQDLRWHKFFLDMVKS